jgi:hypothetical protein
MVKKERKKDTFDKAIEKAELLEAEKQRLEELEKEEKLAYIG